MTMLAGGALPAIALLTCWPESVAVGSGTAVAQRSLTGMLAISDVTSETFQTSDFASSYPGLLRRWRRNRKRPRGLEQYDAVLGIDGEGWPYAAALRVPYIAVCKAVLADVVPHESGAIRRILSVQARWEGASARAASGVIAASEYAAQQIAQHYRVDRARMAVIPEPFDFAAWRARLPSSAREPLVLAVGHHYPRKNYHRLLDAWAEVAQVRPDARLVLVGSGPLSHELARRVAGLRGAELLGHVPYARLLELYVRASVFCHPSLQENFGIAIVEALASGLNLVTHHQPAVLETVSGLNGVWSVDASQPAELAGALIHALDAPQPGRSQALGLLEARLDPQRVAQDLRRALARMGVPLPAID